MKNLLSTLLLLAILAMCLTSCYSGASTPCYAYQNVELDTEFTE